MNIRALFSFKSLIYSTSCSFFIVLGIINRLYDPLYINSALPYSDSYFLLNQVSDILTYHKIIGVSYYTNIFSYLLAAPQFAFQTDSILVIKWLGPFLGILLLLTSFWVLKKLLNDKYAVLLGVIAFASVFPFGWLFLRSDITRAEGAGLFLFCIILLFIMFHQQTGKPRYINLSWILFIIILILDPLPAIPVLIFLSIYEIISRSKHWKLRLFSILALGLLASSYILNSYAQQWGFEKSLSIFANNLFSLEAPVSMTIFDSIGIVFTVLSLIGVAYTVIKKDKKFLPFTISWLIFFVLLYIPIYWFSLSTLPLAIKRLESFFELLTLFQGAIGLEAILVTLAKIQSLKSLKEQKVLNNYLNKVRILTIIFVLLLMVTPLIQNSLSSYVSSTGLANEDFTALWWLKNNNGLSNNSVLIVIGSYAQAFGMQQSEFREIVLRSLTTKSNVTYLDVSDWPRVQNAIKEQQPNATNVSVMLSITFSNWTYLDNLRGLLVSNGYALVYDKGALIFRAQNGNSTSGLN